YLAGGQARAAKEIIDAITLYETSEGRDFAKGEPIDLSAVVELKTNGATSTYFIGPKGGGLEVQFDKNEIIVITPHSPLGQNLMGKKAGDRWTAEIGGAKVKYEIASVV